MTERLFVYGTLRKDSRRSMHRMLGQQATFVGYGHTRGHLYHLGGYPGLVPSGEARAWVRGEVYALAHPSEVLARLDDYEGCGPNDAKPYEFERVKGEVVLESGEIRVAWIYVYAGMLGGRTEIASGDYCSQLGDSKPEPRE